MLRQPMKKNLLVVDFPLIILFDNLINFFDKAFFAFKFFDINLNIVCTKLFFSSLANLQGEWYSEAGQIRGVFGYIN